MTNNDEMPLISIVTVIFNGEKFLEDTIKSVINQTYKNVEYIIIDGGSTDGTIDIIKKYGNQIDYWVSEPDNGIYDAMNKGIETASGKWINFMNGGDRFYNDHVLEKIFKNQINNDITFIYGNTVYNYESFKSERKALPLYEHWKQIPFRHQSVFIKTKVHKNNKFNLSFKISADFDFFFKLLFKGYKTSYIDLTISEVTVDGVSENKRIAVIFEKLRIVNYINPKRQYNLYYAKSLIRELATKLLKLVLPKKIILYIQLKKQRKN